MASHAQRKWENAQQIEKKLLSLTKSPADTFDDIDYLINLFRGECEATIFLDFEYATEKEVGDRLWIAHTSINTRYRKLVENYKKGDQRKHVVERRKMEKRYVDFIKMSQYFYKGYIQRLASHFAGMIGLRRIAHCLSLSVLSIDERVKVPPNVEQMIELSCHTTLLHLGDLSRYRNNLRSKDRSWGPTLGYYGLANDLCPDSGSPHNQMAVVALAEGDHLDAIYHLYRALAVKEPHELAQRNLELEFKKIILKSEKKRPQPKTDSLGTLVAWFTLLHAKFYEGVEFSTRDELENEVLSRLVLLLKEQAFGETLEKIVLINIAAEEFAADQASGGQSFTFFLTFNVRMMFVLLQVLQPELEDLSTGEDLPNGTEDSQRCPEKISAICRRLLPAIRQYSIWLLVRSEFLVGSVRKYSLESHVKDMWQMYANVLTRLVNFFPVHGFIRSAYLLEEDETTVGFKPFQATEIPVDCNFYVDGNSNLKPRITDPGQERNHPNVEMQARILDIILVGLHFHRAPQIPMSLNGDTGSPVFTFVEEGLQLTSPGRPQSSGEQFNSSINTSQDFSMPEPINRNLQVTPDGSVAASDSHCSIDIDMHRMVENLLEPSVSRNTDSCSNETSYGMHSRTADEIFAPLASSGNYIQTHQSTPKMLPSLPGIWSSPFTPKPNELQPTSPDRPTTAHQHSSLQYVTSEQRMAAADALDQITGYGTAKSGSWSWRASRPLTSSSRNSQQQSSINHLLQESLFQKYKPLSNSSSAFSDSSSLYANTPQYQTNRVTGGTALRNTTNGGNSTIYAGASDVDKNTMLRSSLWNGCQPAWGAGGSNYTPPGAQGD